MRFRVAGLLLLIGTPAAGAPLRIEMPGLVDGGSMGRSAAASADDCGGDGVSPAIDWQGVPRNARSLALTVFDPDARAGAGFVHWVLYGLPPTLTGLAQGAGAHTPAGSRGGENSPGSRLYFGACPPVGDPAHHYIFSLYAVDLPPAALPAGLSEKRLLSALEGHVLAEARFTLRYQRP